MTQEDLKNKIKDILQTNVLCVVSSLSSEGVPQSATVGFSQDENFNIVIGTSVKSRKAANIQANSNVSVVVGVNSEVRQTLQIEGTATILEAVGLEKYRKIHTAKLPFTKKSQDDPDERLIIVKPNWIRFTDISQNPWLVEELNLGNI